ncbi:MAG: type II toxin-antitoxin system VapB family antitoxin [Symbiopectobacterium sp.]
MCIVSISKNGNNLAIRLPRDMDFEGVTELEIAREGDTLILAQIKPSLNSCLQEAKADANFLTEREIVVCDEGYFQL